jgi:hypothetical protein
MSGRGHEQVLFVFYEVVKDELQIKENVKSKKQHGGLIILNCMQTLLRRCHNKTKTNCTWRPR